MELYGRLEKDPDNTYVDIALDGSKCRAVIIAYTSNDYVWIWQSRSTKKFKNQKEMINRLKLWAKHKKAKNVKMQTYNNKLEKFYNRRYGFTKHGDTMELAV